MLQKANPYLIPAILAFHSGVWLFVFGFLSVPPDMADEWVWSRELFLGYYEHPPMIAYFIRAFSWLSEDPITALKWGVGIYSGFLLGLICFLASMAWGNRCALILCLLLILTLYYNSMTLFWHIQPMLTFWVLGLMCCHRFVKTKNPNLILLFGIVAGLGLLSKYTLGLLYVSCFIWVLITPAYRFLWRTYQFWLAPVLTLLVFSPNIYWNATNNWASMSFVFNKGLADGNGSYLQFLIFTAGHILLFNPVLSVYGLGNLLRLRFRALDLETEPEFVSLLVIVSSVSLSVFSLASFSGGHADPMWVEAGYTALLMLCARKLDLMIGKGSKFPFRFLCSATFVQLVLLGAVFSQAFFSFLPVPYDGDRTKWMIDWPSSGREVERIIREHNEGEIPPYLITREYQLAGSLSLYLSDHPFFFTLEKPERNQWAGKKEILAQSSNYLICRQNSCKSALRKAKKVLNRNFKWIGNVETDFNGKPVRKLSVYHMQKPSP